MDWGIVLLALLIGLACYTDMTSHKIPNRLTLLGALSGLSYHTLVSSWAGVRFSLTGLLVGAGLTLILYVVKAIEAGDVKLFIAMGAIMGSSFVGYTLLYAIMVAGCIGLVFMFVRQEFLLRTLAVIQGGSTIGLFTFPFMYAVLPGAIIGLIRTGGV